MQAKPENQDFKQFDVDSLIEPEGAVRIEIKESTIIELSESMKEIGLIQPIVISEQAGQLEIVVGHRRWLAAKRLGWKKIDAIIRVMDRTQIALIRATENLQREGLSYIEEAGIYKDLQENHNLSLREIADRVGKEHVTVHSRLRLLEMAPEIQHAIHTKEINPYVAIELNKIKEKEALNRYLNIAIENGVTAKVMRQWAEDWERGLRYKSPGSGGGSPVQETKREQKSFTMCEFCQGPVEYKDAHNLTACATCNDLIITVINQGYFKEGGK